MHEVEKAARGGLPWVSALSDPMNRDTDRRATHHGQVESRGAIGDAATVFARAYI